jgi:DNA-binding MarR family transcriptional regulator
VAGRKAAEADLTAAEAEVVQATAEDARNTRLRGTGAVSLSEWDKTRSARDVAVGRRARAREALTLARIATPSGKNHRPPLDRPIFACTIKLRRHEMGAEHRDTMIDRIASECVAGRLRMLNRVITNIYDDAFRPLDLKVSQISILVATAKLGTARPTEVCEHLHLDVSTLSRNVERMKARGWLEVVPEEDARSQPFRLTAQGKRLIEKAIPAWEKAQQQASELLGSEGISLLDKAAKKAGTSQADR